MSDCCTGPFIGDTVFIRVFIRDFDQKTLIDPGALKFTYFYPNTGTLTELPYIINVDDPVNREDKGIYTAKYDIEESGILTYGVEVSGSASKKIYGSITVSDTPNS